MRITALAMVLAGALTGCFSASPPYGPLHRAAMTGDVETVKQWIRDGKNLDVKYDDTGTTLETNSGKIRGLTPLMVAARAGHLEVVKLLVEGGANLYAESSTARVTGSGRGDYAESGYFDGPYPANPFDYAVEGSFTEGGHVDVAAYLWEKSDKVRFAGKLPMQLFHACLRSCDDSHPADATTNLALFIAGITRNEEDLGNGIGLIACQRDGLARLKFLAQHGVHFPKNTLRCLTGYSGSQVNFNNMPQTRLDIVQYLLDHGADPNAAPTDSYYATPLGRAAAWTDVPMAGFLLAHGADPNMPDHEGLTPVMHAVNTCAYQRPAAASAVPPNLPGQLSQLAMLEQLMKAGAHPAFNMKMAAFAECCVQQPHSAAQEKICRIFGKQTK